MTPKQLKETTSDNLILIFKNKARCVYSENITLSVYRELKNRLTEEQQLKLLIAKSHMINGEDDEEFNEICDNLINQLKK